MGRYGVAEDGKGQRRKGKGSEGGEAADRHGVMRPVWWCGVVVGVGLVGVVATPFFLSLPLCFLRTPSARATG